MPTSPEQAEQRRSQRLLFVSVLFAVLLNFPLLALFDQDGRVGGIPIVYLYLLSAWILIVVITGWLVSSIKN